MRQALLQALRLRYFDVTTPFEVGLLGETDAGQLQWAAVHKRVLFSYNRCDFYRLHAEWMEPVNEQRIITTDQDFEEMIWRGGKRHCGICVWKIYLVPKERSCSRTL
jgi:hypothetical protein